MLPYMNITSGKPYPLGATRQGSDVNFAVYAKGISCLSLCLYQEGTTDPTQEIPLDPLTNKTGDIWHIQLEGCPDDILYDYCATPKDGTKQYLLDPYSKAIASDSIWNYASVSAYKPLGKIIDNTPFDWEGIGHPQIPMKDLIIYEMHVRGFTVDSSSHVEKPGTYLGVIEKLPYLKNLGVNAIELMPIFEFNEKENPFINPKTHRSLVNYFGYSTVNFFSPMNRFASNSSSDQSLIEFKNLVKECHKNGIEVILDVVFNHTGEGGSTGPILSFKGLDIHAYYLLDSHGQHQNFSGCGNTFNCNHPIAIQFILDALRYWAVEMHVDGFRFDLASIMTRDTDGTPLSKAPLVEAISKDPVLIDTKLIAEAWDPTGLYQLGIFGGSDRWAEWNGRYRDVVRRFIKGTSGYKSAFATALCGSQDLYGHMKNPTCSVNFITCHDGFTLQDLVSYTDKHNIENGEDNRDGTNQNDSWNCSVEGPSHNKKVIQLRERQKRNFHLALMVSQGVPMIFMGDEYGHTKFGNNNSWGQDNRLNWFLWDQLASDQGFFRYYRSLIHYREGHPLLKQGSFLTEKEITWHGLMPDHPEWDKDNFFVAFTLNTPSQGPQLYIAFNADHHAHNITLPHPHKGNHWRCVVNTYLPSPDDFYDEGNRPIIQGNNFHIQSRSAILLECH